MFQTSPATDKSDNDEPELKIIDVFICKLRKKLAEEFMELKLSPKMFDQLITQLREHLNGIRSIEKTVMLRCVRDAGMPRSDFIETFPRNETNLGWLDKHVRAKRKHSAALAKYREEIEREQTKLAGIEQRARLSRSTDHSIWILFSARPFSMALGRTWAQGFLFLGGLINLLELVLNVHAAAGAASVTATHFALTGVRLRNGSAGPPPPANAGSMGLLNNGF